MGTELTKAMSLGGMVYERKSGEHLWLLNPLAGRLNTRGWGKIEEKIRPIGLARLQKGEARASRGERARLLDICAVLGAGGPRGAILTARQKEKEGTNVQVIR